MQNKQNKGLIKKPPVSFTLPQKSTSKAGFKFAQKKDAKSKKQEITQESKESLEKQALIQTFETQYLPKELKPLLDPHSPLCDRTRAFVLGKHLLSLLTLETWPAHATSLLSLYSMNSLDHYLSSLPKPTSLHPFHPSHNTLTFKPLNPICTASHHFMASLLFELARTISLIESAIEEGGSTFQWLVTLKVKAMDLYQDEVTLISGTVDFKHLLSMYMQSTCCEELEEREKALRKMWRAVGFDTMGDGNNLTNIRVISYQIQRCNGYAKTEGKWEMQHLQHVEGYVKAEKSLYAISRARIQYLGQNIPLFRYGHALFEALISAIHPEDVSPEGGQDLTNHVLSLQEKSLMRHFLTFHSDPSLSPLLTLSLQGDTLSFIAHFNALTHHEEYSRTKLSLYDINQRKFVIDNTAHPRKGFMVHYNGYVFGTNHAKMFTIREREVGLHQQEEDSEQSGSQISIEFESDKFAKPLELKPAIEKAENDIVDDDSLMSSSESMIDSDDLDDEPRRGANRDDVVSEVDMRQAFVMTSNIVKTSNRKKKMLALLPKNNGSISSGCGLLAVKIEYAKTQVSEHVEQKTIKRLICYGTFPWITAGAGVTQYSQQKTQQVFKVFEGQDAHLLFLAWLLQHVINYKKDSRSHSRFVNIFTCKGSSKELPLLLKGLVSLVGRDTHFVGDINRLKLVWYENIRFYDFSNYFESRSLGYYAQRWVRSPTQIEQLKKTARGDLTVLKTLILYEVTLKFIDELQSIAFNNGKNFYDLTLHGQASANSLALSIFQYMYLDKQHIKGTSEQDIFEVEKKSLKGAYFTKSSIVKELQMKRSPEEEQDTRFALYEIKHSIPLCFKDFPIPFEYTKRREYRFAFTFEEGHYETSYKHQQSLDVLNPHTRQSFKLMYTSLYRVTKLTKLKNTFILPEQTSHGLKYNITELFEHYIWGAELIHAINEIPGRSVIAYLEVAEEISYLQGKIFSHFVNEIWEKHRYTQNPCQKDILEMILQSFPSKFTQNYFGIQQIIHINDLNLMKQTCLNLTENQDGSIQQPIHRLYELTHPYYYIEYFPSGSDHLQQICSLVRITSYINACHRVKQFQALQQFDSPRSISSIMYMDQQYLLLKDRELIDQQIAKMVLPMAAKGSNVGEMMGKYRMILKAKYGDEELQAYMRHFKQRGEVLDIMRNLSSHLGDALPTEESDQSILSFQSFLKCFQNYKLIATLPKTTDEGTLINQFLQIVLSRVDEQGRVQMYQNAPVIQENEQHQKGQKSQRAVLSQIKYTVKYQYIISSGLKIFDLQS